MQPHYRLGGSAPANTPDDREHHDRSHDRSDQPARADAQTVACHQAREEPADERSDETCHQGQLPIDLTARAEHELCDPAGGETEDDHRKDQHRISLITCSSPLTNGLPVRWRLSQPGEDAILRRVSRDVQRREGKVTLRSHSATCFSGGVLWKSGGATLVRLRRRDVRNRRRLQQPSRDFPPIMKKEYFAGGTLVYDNLQFWGWAWLIVGVVQVIAAMMLLAGQGRVLGIILAALSAVISFTSIGAYPDLVDHRDRPGRPDHPRIDHGAGRRVTAFFHGRQVAHPPGAAPPPMR